MKRDYNRKALNYSVKHSRCYAKRWFQSFPNHRKQCWAPSSFYAFKHFFKKRDTRGQKSPHTPLPSPTFRFLAILWALYPFLPLAHLWIRCCNLTLVVLQGRQQQFFLHHFARGPVLIPFIFAGLLVVNFTFLLRFLKIKQAKSKNFQRQGKYCTEFP